MLNNFTFPERLRLKRSMLGFPAAPSMRSRTDQVSTVLPDSDGLSDHTLHLGQEAHLTLQSSRQVLAKQIGIHNDVILYNYWRRLRREEAYAPYQLTSVVHQAVTASDDRKKTAKSKKPGGTASECWLFVLLFWNRLGLNYMQLHSGVSHYWLRPP